MWCENVWLLTACANEVICPMQRIPSFCLRQVIHVRKLKVWSSKTCKKSESKVEYYYYARKVKVRLSKKCFEKSLLV